MTDEEIAKDIATKLGFRSDYPFDKFSAETAAMEMAEYKNQQFNKCLFGVRAVLKYLEVPDDKISKLVEAIYNDYIN